MSEKYLGEGIGKLGFGYMRLPRKDGAFDHESVNEMVDEFLASGFSYFDTSYIYEGSEEALNKSLVKRYPRDSFQITTRVAIMIGPRTRENLQMQLDTSLKRLGVDYVDNYMMHALGDGTVELADTLDAWGFLRGVKEKGLAKHIGFSYHGTPETLDKILTDHPEVEIVQLQINYLDWENPEVQSRRLYEIVRKHNKPFTIMEPTKGGLLAGGESNAAEFLKKANPDASVASWAFRYVGGLEGLVTALSGMENIDHIRDNANTFKNFKPLSDEEHEIIKQAVEIINSTPRVPCTTCNYCVPHCPMKIRIPTFIEIYNKFLVHGNRNSSGYTYASMTRFGSGPSKCTKCKACEEHCPQRIEISEVMGKVAEELEGTIENFIIRTDTSEQNFQRG